MQPSIYQKGISGRVCLSTDCMNVRACVPCYWGSAVYDCTKLSYRQHIATMTQIPRLQLHVSRQDHRTRYHDNLSHQMNIHTATVCQRGLGKRDQNKIKVKLKNLFKTIQRCSNHVEDQALMTCIPSDRSV